MYLYVVNFKDHPDLVKVGISKVLKSRISQLKAIYGAIDRVEVYRGRMYKYAEKILHHRFREENVPLENTGGTEFFKVGFDSPIFQDVFQTCEMKPVDISRIKWKPETEINDVKQIYEYWPEFIHHVRDNGDLKHTMGMIFDSSPEHNSICIPFDYQDMNSQFIREIENICSWIGISIEQKCDDRRTIIIKNFSNKLIGFQSHLTKPDFLELIDRSIKKLDYSKELIELKTKG